MIYSPPKNNTGKTVSLLGTAASAIAPLTGPAAPFIMAAGGIASLVGGVIGNNEQEKLDKYNALYQDKQEGMKAQDDSYQSNLNQGRSNYTQAGITSSIKTIGGLLNPASNVPSNGGTGIYNKRLI